MFPKRAVGLAGAITVTGNSCGLRLEAARVHNFGGGVPVEGVEAGSVVEPVVQSDEVDVASWLYDPPETKLPAENAAGGVVLDIVCDRHPRVELGIHHGAKDLCRKASFRQFDPVQRFQQTASNPGTDSSAH